MKKIVGCYGNYGSILETVIYGEDPSTDEAFEAASLSA